MLPIIRNHHERWDGTGYPDRLSQRQIPRLAAIRGRNAFLMLDDLAERLGKDMARR